VAVNCISVEILEINNEDANISPLCKSLFFNTKRYVAVSNIKLGSRDFEEITLTLLNKHFWLYSYCAL
jgi:hypothetical protein